MPPFHIQLINSSPRVTSDRASINFVTSKPASSVCSIKGSDISHVADCELIRGRANCNGYCQSSQPIGSDGIVEYDLPQGSYIFRIVSRTENRERDVVRRRINIGMEITNIYQTLAASHLDRHYLTFTLHLLPKVNKELLWP